MSGPRWWSVTICDGTRKLHTFDFAPCADDPAAMGWHHRAVVGHGHHRVDLAAEAALAAELWRPGMAPLEFAAAMQKRQPYRRYLPETFNHTPLHRIPGRLNIAAGVNPPGTTLRFILDALRAGGRSQVDVADLKAVVSLYGDRIAALDTIAADQRRHAEDALCRAIRARCTSL